MAAEQATIATAQGVFDRSEQIVSYLLEEDHTYLRREMPRLLRLMQRIRREECSLEVRSQLEELIELFNVFQHNEQTHMKREEREIFPGLLDGLAGLSLEQAVQIIGQEHQTFGFMFERFYAMLNVIEAELAHCATYRTLRDGLTSLAQRLKEHIWLEEQLLAALVIFTPAAV